MTLPAVRLVAPAPFSRTSGGYCYDREILAGLRRLGVHAEPLAVEGPFPGPDSRAARSLDRALEGLADGTLVVLDGLAAGAAPTVVSAHAPRLCLIALVHHPLHLEAPDHLEEPDEGHPPGGREALRTLEAAGLVRVRGVIVPSEASAGSVRELGIPAERIRIVAPGVRLPSSPVGPVGDRHAGEGSDEEVRLLAVGALIPRKGLHVLLEVLAELDAPPWSLDVVGSTEADPIYAARLRERAEQPDLASRIRIRGELPEAALEELRSQAHLAVHPALHEGWGIVLAEAMVRGLPVVTTTAGAIPDVVPPGAGARVPPGDPVALRAALVRFIVDREARRRAGEVARNHARNLPDWSTQARAFRTALEELRADVAAPSASPNQRGTPDGIPGKFEPAWLRLREPVDHRSRSTGLEDLLMERARREGWDTAVDLGGGTGSNVRHLSRRLQGAGIPIPRWTVVDHDPRLLAALPPQVGAVRGSLAEQGLQVAAGSALVTASALLDLVTGEWIEALADSLETTTRAVLLTLSWDGSARWREADPPADPRPGPDGDRHPPLRSDPRMEALMAAVHRHQEGDKGMGPALGPRAPRVAEEVFRRRGWEVHRAHAPWQLDAADLALALELVRGWLEAAAEVDPGTSEAARSLLEDRLHLLARGQLVLEVGHLDLLALPPRGALIDPGRVT
ncbi:MAG: glycosyltransferase family 1 protein [Gemmatimonadales bacterium]|nr:MAG: glycosyltransferase family 1 protein [Gemmatimonadales bacterium]